MHGTLSRRGRAAMRASGKVAVDRAGSGGNDTSGGKSATDENWFSTAAWDLYGKNPGEPLHIVTGLGDVRACQRYAAGDVKPPAYFLRRLLRSDHGRQWLGATMQGSTADWWIDMQRAERVAAAIDAVRE